MAIKHVSLCESSELISNKFMTFFLNTIHKALNHLLERVSYMVLDGSLPGFHATLEIVKGVGCKLDMRYRKPSGDRCIYDRFSNQGTTYIRFLFAIPQK